MSNVQIRGFPDDLFRELEPLASESGVHLKEARELAMRMSKQVFTNADSFKFVYFTAGATGALDHLLSRPTIADPAEYRYVFAHPTVKPDEGDTRYVTYPSSITGNHPTLPDGRLIIDAAYAFCTELEPAELPPKTQYVIFSLSKSHNVADYRVGWFLSKRPIAHLHVLQYEYDYGSSLVYPLLEKASRYAANELFLRHGSQLKDRLTAAGCTVGSVPLFGFTSTGERIPFYTV
jgi:hypothetical protein